MNYSPSTSILAYGIAFFILTFAAHGSAAGQIALTSSPHGTYVFFQRTDGHVRLSTPEVFQQVVDDIQGYLTANGVTTIRDRGADSSGAELPLPAVQEMARHAGSEYLLYVMVDRPMTKWLKVTVECYDASGRQVWQEQADAGSGWSSNKKVHETLLKVEEGLNRRLGQPGLLRDASDQKPTTAARTESESASASDRQAPEANVRLADGTPVHLLLTEAVSSKTARQGSTVKLQVLDDVKVGDLIVIANKAPAFATIETAKSAGRAWRAGSLLLKLGAVTMLNQQQQPLRAWNAVKGKDTGAAIDWTNAVIQSYGLALFFLPLAPLQHGNQAFLPRGTVLEAVIDGEVLLPRAAMVAAQSKPTEPRHGPASVTFYYPDFEHGPSVDVWCGAIKVGRLKKGGKFTMSFPPGRYWLRTWNSSKSPTTLLAVEDGGEEYVSVTTVQQRTGTNVWWRQQLSVVPHDVGEAQSVDTYPAKSHGVRDLAKVDPTELQADPQAKKK
jgi:hypothetical protein